MTANQLAYWKNVETERHNRATEAEEYRSNVASVGEQMRANMAREAENYRYNTLQHQLGTNELAELMRSNVARETENYRSNTLRHQLGTNELAELMRSNDMKHYADIMGINAQNLRSAFQNSSNAKTIFGRILGGANIMDTQTSGWVGASPYYRGKIQAPTLAEKLDPINYEIANKGDRDSRVLNSYLPNLANFIETFANDARDTIRRLFGVEAGKGKF